MGLHLRGGARIQVAPVPVEDAPRSPASIRGLRSGLRGRPGDGVVCGHGGPDDGLEPGAGGGGQLRLLLPLLPLRVGIRQHAQRPAAHRVAELRRCCRRGYREKGLHGLPRLPNGHVHLRLPPGPEHPEGELTLPCIRRGRAGSHSGGDVHVGVQAVLARARPRAETACAAQQVSGLGPAARSARGPGRTGGGEVRGGGGRECSSGPAAQEQVPLPPVLQPPRVAAAAERGDGRGGC
mmetsp:Transcript_72277/g.227867  ORF Transcript_72277/g.227867 Transcript_72277/m.227867 type:complete len:237 (-) Transcript_72277:429-1139(-)